MNTSYVVNGSGTVTLTEADSMSGAVNDLVHFLVDAEDEAKKHAGDLYFYGVACLIVLASVLSLYISGDTQSTRIDTFKSLKMPLTVSSSKAVNVNSLYGYGISSVSNVKDDRSGKLKQFSLLANRSLTTIQPEPLLPNILMRIAPADVFPGGGLVAPRVQEISVQGNKVVTLESIWDKYSTYKTGFQKLLQEYQELQKSGLWPKGASIEFAKSESVSVQLEGGDIKGLKRVLADGTVLHFAGDSVGGFEGSVKSPIVRDEIKVLSGSIESNLSEAARAASLPYEMIDQLVDLFGNRVDFRKDLRRGDTFAVKYVNRFSDVQGELAPGPLMAVSLNIKGQVYAAIRHQRADGSVIYVDEHGQPLGDYFLKYPLSYSRITSVYSDSRMHPVLRIKRPHYGVDFAAPIGTPVRSIGDGIVKEASYKGSAGRMIRIEHNSTYATAYLHLHSIKSNIRPGMRVARGEVIGTVGQTGLASGPHLHFSLYKNGKYVDPLSEKLHWEMPLKDRIDPKVLRVTLRELGTFHQAYLRRVSVVDKGQGAGGSTDLSHGDLMHKMVLAHNVNDDVASMVNQGAKPHNHHRLGDELDVILEDPRLQLKGNRGKPCDSLNVFACSPR